MAASRLFTTTRPTVPDLGALIASLRATVDPTAGCALEGNTVRVKISADDWTPAQLVAAQTAIDTAPAMTRQSGYQRTSREKDMLATMAMIVRAKNLAAWNAMTAVQKRDAVFSEADVWVNIRDFIETNT